MELISIITTYFVPVAAVIGLILSIINTYFQWSQYRRKVAVEFYYVDKDFDLALGDYTFDGYIIRVKNLGHVDIIIEYAGMKWKNQEYQRNYYGSIMTQHWNNFPYNLRPGKSFSVEFYGSEIRDQIMKWDSSGNLAVRGFIKSGEGKYYFSRSMEIKARKIKK